MALPEKGKVYNGYIFKGGDPNDRASWGFVPKQETYDPTEGMSGMDKFLAGVGSGMTDIGRKATNLVLPKQLEPAWATDEAIEEQKKTDKALLKTGAGMAGNIVGATAATLPVGGAVGGALKAGAGAARTGSVLQKALTSGAGSPLVRNTLEGIVSGAISANPGDRLSGAATGGILSGAMTGGGKVLKRAFGTGAVKTSKAAQELIDEGMDLPLSSAASDEGGSGLVRHLYRDALPYIPGGRAVAKQSAKSFNQARKRIFEETVPDWAHDTLVPALDNLDEQDAMRLVNDFWENRAYQGVKSYAYNASDNWIKDAGKIPEVAMKKLTRALGNKKIVSGEDLLNAKNDLWKMASSSKDRNIEGYYRKAAEHVDNMIEHQLRHGNSKQAVAVLDEYKSLKEPYKKYLDVVGAMSDASENEGRYTFKQLAKASAERVANKKAAEGSGAVQEIAKQYHKGMGDPLIDPTLWRQVAVLGLLGGGSALVDPAVAPAIMGSAYVLSRKGTQKALMGNTNVQKALVEALRKAEPVTKNLGYGARMGAVQYANRRDQ